MATKILKRRKIITKVKGFKIPPIFQFKAEIQSVKHKISINTHNCKRCDLYLKPKDCVEFINKNSPVLPGFLPFFALGLRFDMSGDYHRCFQNKNTKPELWSPNYGIEKVKGAATKKAVEVFEELKNYLNPYADNDYIRNSIYAFAEAYPDKKILL